MKVHLTRVELIEEPARRNVYLRFGKSDREHQPVPGRRVVYFPSNAVFGHIRWHGNEYGTTLWQASVLRAVVPGEAASKITGIYPGAQVLLRVSAQENIRFVLALIDGIEALGVEPSVINPDYWRTVHNRLLTRISVPEYTLEGHAAYLTRRELKS